MFDRFTGGMCPLDVCYTWFLRAAKPGQHFAEKEGIDLLWATAPPYSALYLAYLIHEKTGIPYVVDYRDARVTSIDHTSRREQRDWEYENRAAASSAGYTYVAPDQKGVLERTVPTLRDKPSILAHNWIEQDKLDRCPPKQWRNHTVVHGGTVYGGTRRMDGIARAVTALAGETGLRLENYGPMVDHKFLKSITDEAGESGHVNLNAPLPYSEFISACKGAAILLLLIAEDSHRRQHAGAIPGKLYDYLGCHRPILVVGPKGCEAGKMVEVMRRGIACVPDDYTGITVAMSKLLREEGRDGPLDLRPAAVADYQSGNVVARMDGFFNSIVKGDEK